MFKMSSAGCNAGCQSLDSVTQQTVQAVILRRTDVSLSRPLTLAQMNAHHARRVPLFKLRLKLRTKTKLLCTTNGLRPKITILFLAN